MHSETPSASPVTRARYRAGLVSLLRPVNALVAFAGIGAACLIAGADGDDVPRILMTAAAGTLLGAAGNVINDVFDVAIDRINKPRRAVAAGIVSRSAATRWAVLLAVAGLALSAPLGRDPFAIAAGSAVLLYLYSARLKRIPLLGNIAVGLLTAAAFVFGGAAFGNPAAGLVPAAFAFLFNVAREVLKDVEDMRGDGLNAVRTFPLVAGERAALAFVSAALSLVIAGSAFPYWFSLYGNLYIWVVFFGVDCVLAYVLFAMWNDRSTGNLARLNLLLKYDMLPGILAIALGTR